MFRALVEFFSHHRLMCAAGVVLATLVAIYGNFIALEPLFSRAEREPNGEFDQLDEVNRQFESGGDFFLVVESPALFEPKTFAVVRRLAQAIESDELVDSVITLDRVPVFDELGLPGRLMPQNGASREAFLAARERALAHPLIVGQLLSEDGQTMVLPVMFKRREGNERQDSRQSKGTDAAVADSDKNAPNEEQPIRREKRLEVVERIDAAVHAALQGADLQVRLTGRIPLNKEQTATFEYEERKFRLIGFTLVFVLAAIIFRGLEAVLIVASACGLGLFWTIGALNLIGEDMNQLTSVILPVMLVMVGFTDGVHIMVDIRRSRAAGVSPLEASRHATLHLGMACALTSLTTAIGFGSLMIAESEVIRSFGRSCAIGVALMFVSVVTVIPLLSSTWLGRNIHRGHEHDIVNRNMTMLYGMIAWVTRHAKLVASGGTLLTLALVALALATLRPDNRIEDDFPSNSRAYQALKHCDEALGGIQFIQVVIDWPENVSEQSPELFETLRDVDQLLNDEPLVRYPLSILNLVRSLPGNEEDLAGQSRWLKLLPKSVSRRFMKVESRRALVTGRVQDLGIASYEPVFQRLEEKLAALEAVRPGFRLKLSGGPVVMGRTLHSIISDLAKSLGMAAVIIFVVLGIAFRSALIGLISVVPNLFPLAVTATMLVAMGRPLEISSVCAFTICLGIAVDDTIHFLTRFRRELAVDGDVEGALARSIIGVGTALLMTTVVLVAGFATVISSELPGNRTFGLMACSTIGAALVGDLIILPAMLACFVPRSAAAQEALHLREVIEDEPEAELLNETAR